jgi:hypothetical protein
MDLNDRCMAQEAIYARGEEYNFRVNMQACALLARWIAEEKLKLDARETDRYCGAIIAASVRNCNPQTLFEYIQGKLEKYDVSLSNEELEYRYLLALQTARA